MSSESLARIRDLRLAAASLVCRRTIVVGRLLGNIPNVGPPFAVLASGSSGRVTGERGGGVMDW